MAEAKSLPSSSSAVHAHPSPPPHAQHTLTPTSFKSLRAAASQTLTLQATFHCTKDTTSSFPCSDSKEGEKKIQTPVPGESPELTLYS